MDSNLGKKFPCTPSIVQKSGPSLKLGPKFGENYPILKTKIFFFRDHPITLLHYWLTKFHENLLSRSSKSKMIRFEPKFGLSINYVWKIKFYFKNWPTPIWCWCNYDALLPSKTLKYPYLNCHEPKLSSCGPKFWQKYSFWANNIFSK